MPKVKQICGSELGVANKPVELRDRVILKRGITRVPPFVTNGDADITSQTHPADFKTLYAGKTIYQTEITSARAYYIGGVGSDNEVLHNPGDKYHFVGVGTGAAEETTQLTFDLPDTSATNAAVFQGAIQFNDLSDDDSGGALNTVVWANGTTHNRLVLARWAYYDIHLVVSNDLTSGGVRIINIYGTMSATSGPSFDANTDNT